MDEMHEWFVRLAWSDPVSADLVAAAINQLEADGPTWAARLWTGSADRRFTT
ncbi:hypothetical protein [Pseudofrankia sp. BMG5.37]|uniref:hypothetical protein n=1 Tax=Pseudofrankia sp. BMG5.37 TaxID=3050035 RepID=UPI00289F5BB2|nr:hypothetical protein [Pseudofrankia sp. BMG5.37]